MEFEIDDSVVEQALEDGITNWLDNNGIDNDALEDWLDRHIDLEEPICEYLDEHMPTEQRIAQWAKDAVEDRFADQFVTLKRHEILQNAFNHLNDSFTNLAKVAKDNEAKCARLLILLEAQQAILEDVLDRKPWWKFW
jgi:hypothetical protein